MSVCVSSQHCAQTLALAVFLPPALTSGSAVNLLTKDLSKE